MIQVDGKRDPCVSEPCLAAKGSCTGVHAYWRMDEFAGRIAILRSRRLVEPIRALDRLPSFAFSLGFVHRLHKRIGWMLERLTSPRPPTRSVQNPACISPPSCCFPPSTSFPSPPSPSTSTSTPPPTSSPSPPPQTSPSSPSPSPPPQPTA